MKTHTLSQLLLSALLLVLMGCTEVPTRPTEESLEATRNKTTSIAPKQALTTLFTVHMPQQTVKALRDGEETKAEVEAKIEIFSDGTAKGEWGWEEEGRIVFHGKVVNQAFEGKGIFDASGNLDAIEIAFREANGELIFATVKPNIIDIESQDKLTFVALDNEQVLSHSFEAIGEIRF